MDEPLQIAGAVAVGIRIAADQHLVEHRPLVPFGIPYLADGVRAHRQLRREWRAFQLKYRRTI